MSRTDIVKGLAQFIIEQMEILEDRNSPVHEEPELLDKMKERIELTTEAINNLVASNWFLKER